MPGKKRVVSENVEVVDVVAEATEKKGLFAQLAKRVKGAGNWCVKHWKGLAIGAATTGAVLYAGAKFAEGEEDGELYLIVDGAEIEHVEEIEDDEESESDETDEEEEVEDNDEETED